MIKFILLLSLYAIVFVIAEALHRKGYEAKITRKLVHIGGGIVSCFIPVLTDLRTGIIMGLGFSVFLFWSKRKKMLDSVHEIASDDLGAALFPLGLIPCALLFWTNIPVYQSSALILGFSDAFACIAGRRYGKRGYSITGYKTVEGSLVFFTVTFLIFISVVLFSRNMVSPDQLLFIVLGSVFVTIVEGMFGRGWDNLFIPVSAGLAAQFILGR